MAGIYGNSKEDKYFENKMLSYLEDTMEVNESVEFDDFQFEAGENVYSVAGCAQIIEGNLVNIFIDHAYEWSDEDQEWFDSDVSDEALEEALSALEEFYELVGLRG